ncbi:MAG: hypothetical protein EA406_02220 [Rhodospirillales bacterium]|nr:MAG: hypothetical protein EA406_02220 [Rhodospirillales bacterium]
MTTEALVEKLFADRKGWESLWDTAYRFIAPERAAIFPTSTPETPTSIQDSVFDATAIDAAEKLVNLLMSGMIPAWAKWFRLRPGPAIRDPSARQQLMPTLQLAEDLILQALTDANFYLEAQPAILDRVVGGTGAVEICTNPRLAFKCVPLSELALAEDTAGRVSHVARKTTYDVASILRLYEDRLTEQKKIELGQKKATDREHVFITCIREPDDSWEYRVVLKGSPEIELEKTITAWPRIVPARWSKIPGYPYGRGPGLRVLSDVRALNKIKELTLKNAALAVGGAWTVVNDGVLNPYTMVLEPGVKIPVASNSPNDPSVLPLPSFANFDVANFSMDDLRNSIKQAFMADQFQPLGRTPMSATEVAERTRVIASDMGASLARLQNEFLMPILKFVANHLQKQGEIPEELGIGDDFVDVQFVSRLAQAQWAEDKANMLELASLAQALGQTDPRAAMVVDSVAVIREVHEYSGLKPEILRSDDDIDEMMQQAMEAQQQGMAGPEQPA